MNTFAKLKSVLLIYTLTLLVACSVTTHKQQEIEALIGQEAAECLLHAEEILAYEMTSPKNRESSTLFVSGYPVLRPLGEVDGEYRSRLMKLLTNPDLYQEEPFKRSLFFPRLGFHFFHHNRRLTVLINAQGNQIEFDYKGETHRLDVESSRQEVVELTEMFTAQSH